MILPPSRDKENGLVKGRRRAAVPAKGGLTVRHQPLINRLLNEDSYGKRRYGMGKHVTKRDLVVRISNETGLVQQQVLEVVQKTLDYISESVANGETVELRNFGVFEVKLRKARVGRNPNAPKRDVPIPPRAVVKFKPGKEMRESVLETQPESVAPARVSVQTQLALPVLDRPATAAAPRA